MKRKVLLIGAGILLTMGWNSWDCYGAAVDEATVRKNAKIVAT